MHGVHIYIVQFFLGLSVTKAKISSKTKKAPRSSPKAKAKEKKAPAKKGLGANEKKWGTTTHKQGWTYVPNILLEHQADLELKPIELNIILTIMKHWWERDKLPWPSVAKVAELIGRSRSIVQRRIRDLEKRGYIQRVYRKDSRKEKANLTNEYDFTGLVNAVADIAKKRQQDKPAAYKSKH